MKRQLDDYLLVAIFVVLCVSITMTLLNVRTDGRGCFYMRDENTITVCP